jgi:hypothetical protein
MVVEYAVCDAEATTFDDTAKREQGGFRIDYGS